MKFFVALMVLVAVGRGPAAAENKIVLESYTGGKTATAAKQLKPLLEALSRKNFNGGYDVVGRSFESRGSKPAIADGLPADFAKKVEAGKDAWVAGKFQDAANALTPLIDLAHDNAGAFAGNKDLVSAVETALIVIALSHERMGDPEAAVGAWTEFLRSFPDRTVPRATWGADSAQAFEKAKKAIAARLGYGKMLVKSSLDTGLIFVNERIEQQGSISKDNLLAGDYRVFVQLGAGRLSRQHRVTVRAKETAVLTIDTDFDMVIQTSPTWTGLAFTSSAEREQFELRAASQFANAVEATAVLVVGIDQVRGKDSIVGVLVDRNGGKDFRRASIPLSSAPSAERLVSLAEFLIGDLTEVPDGIEVDAVAAPKKTGGVIGPVDGGTSSGAWGGWKFVTGGVALVALGAGAYLLSTDGDCKIMPMAGVTCPDVYNNAAPGYAFVAGGAVFAGLSVYLFVRGGSSSSKARTAYVMPTPGGAFAAFSARF